MATKEFIKQSSNILMSLHWTKRIVIPISIAIIIAIVYKFLLNKNVFFLDVIQKPDFKEYSSSVSCLGSNHTERLCTFKNICYDSTSEAFIFFHSSKSIVIGLPEDRFSPALTDFSSVYDHNTQYFNFIDLPSSAISNFNVSIVSGIAIIFKRFNPENLMHVFHDDLIPAFVTLDEIFLLDSNNVHFVFADGREPGPYAYLYEKFLDTKPLYLNSSLSGVICFEKAIVGLNKNSLWYQYGFKKPQGPINKDMSYIFPILINFRKYFQKQFSLNEIGIKNTALLLTRRHNRKILNAENIAKYIETKTNLKTFLISLETHSVIRVIEEIRGSKLIIGMHGSLLILSLFLPSNSHIIELFPYGINPDICTPYKTLAGIPGLQLTYHSWENKMEKNTLSHPEYPSEQGGILHFPKEKQEFIKISVVRPFLCCYNPEWLYRIYQDTVVDLKSFSSVIDNVLKSYQQPVLINSMVYKRLYPSEVQNISCKLSSFNTFNISWEKPWNVDFIDIVTIEYELWYQNNEENDVKAFITKKTHFVFREDVTRNVYIWIRCHTDDRIGPFNSDPLICLKL